ncbi:hypothetical protein AN618_17590 [Fervidicola ferrireducens]|jgi:CRISPR-associated exonuclease Cas4|uniref:CRISPR-associated exonuclease Cas4 n=1 Tax=Fervidicola ferrireducens TaxID=520764 RepID=A0A140L5M4_9FIRM|nr:CRISPR-associated protein Cas4 [Fervidicola ferrireducens]KXG75849.1 hypothetical protein AN618_17590 [Fervidicola ferrireducens]
MVNGNLVQSYVICPRQAWLFSRNLTPDQEHPYIELGRLIDSESYKRDKKKIQFENLVIDIIRSEGSDIVVGEVKKSSKASERGKLQLLYYLYRLKEHGVEARGMLYYPEERKREAVELTTENEKRIERLIREIEDLIVREAPPPFKKIPYCKSCAFREFCMS